MIAADDLLVGHVKNQGSAQFFRFLSGIEEQALLAAAFARDVPAGEVVLEQHAEIGSIFLLDTGIVAIERVESGAPVPLAVLGPGDIFGEMSFVSGHPASARVVAIEAARLRVINTENVECLRATFSGFAGRFYRSIAAILVERLRHTSRDVTWGNNLL